METWNTWHRSRYTSTSDVQYYFYFLHSVNQFWELHVWLQESRLQGRKKPRQPNLCEFKLQDPTKTSWTQKLKKRMLESWILELKIKDSRSKKTYWIPGFRIQDSRSWILNPGIKDSRFKIQKKLLESQDSRFKIQDLESWILGMKIQDSRSQKNFLNAEPWNWRFKIQDQKKLIETQSWILNLQS